MAQLPSTGTSKDKQLNQDPADDASVGGLGLIAEFGFSLLLFPSYQHHPISLNESNLHVETPAPS